MKGNIAQTNLPESTLLRKHYKSTLQPRTAFSYKTPTQERVAGNATSIPRPSEEETIQVRRIRDGIKKLKS